MPQVLQRKSNLPQNESEGSRRSRVNVRDPRNFEQQSTAHISIRKAFDSKVFLANAGEGRSIAQWYKNQTIYSQGDRSDAVFYIQKGKVKLTVVSRLGKEAIVGILGPNEFFGEGCLAGKNDREANVTAITDCVIMRLEKAVLARAIHCES